MRKSLRMSQKSSTFVADYEQYALRRGGEMLEWLKRHAWKACKLQKGFRGSNPRLSARDYVEIPRQKTKKMTLNLKLK